MGNLGAEKALKGDLPAPGSMSEAAIGKNPEKTVDTPDRLS
jgi:hypothetical protein